MLIKSVFIRLHAGFMDAILGLLEAWVAEHAQKPPPRGAQMAAAADAGSAADPGVAPIPRWVDALLLVVDACTQINWQAPARAAQPPASAAQVPLALPSCTYRVVRVALHACMTNGRHAAQW
jgi:hypothetical protein